MVLRVSDSAGDVQVISSGLLLQEYSYRYSAADDYADHITSIRFTDCVLPLEAAQATFDFTLGDATGSVPSSGTESVTAINYVSSAPLYLTSPVAAQRVPGKPLKRACRHLDTTFCWHGHERGTLEVTHDSSFESRGWAQMIPQSIRMSC